MLSFYDDGIRLCDGVTRREWLRVGGLGALSLSLPALLHARRTQGAVDGGGSPFGKAKACILVNLTGGPPQHETWDPKPGAPVEIRGEFRPIASSLPGLDVCELMPQVAQLAHKHAVLRAVATGDNAHSSSGYQMLTGRPHIPLNVESARVGAPNDWPCVAAMVKWLRRREPGLPASVVLPEHIWNDGNFPWPGQDGGFLGRTADPWLIHCDPSSPDFKPPDLAFPPDMSAPRFQGRQRLLEQVDRRLSEVERRAAVARYQLDAVQALDLLQSEKSRTAFDIAREPPAVRERYGMSRYAQSLLLARRLVEAGVSLVQINWTRIKDAPNQGGWDTHQVHNQSLKTLLMPLMDRAYSALIEDLEQRGMLAETLVVWSGEFGRTPRFNPQAGRDHWGPVFSIALTGGGIREGVVHGESDRDGAQPHSGKVTPADVAATIFHTLGYDPRTELHDPVGRPFPLSQGEVIRQIL
ncbi:MAG: DUF1501 domain-containing protein [Planctomycetales bacterium]